MNRWIAGAAIVVLAALATFFGLRAYGSGTADRAEIEQVVRDYLLEHPEVIPEAMARLESREAGERVAAIREPLQRPFAGAWAGNPRGDVTVVEFFDYACGYCRQSMPDIVRLLREDSNVRFVFRELPILSPESETAARYSLVAAQQGDFFAFHQAMYAAGRPSDATIASAMSSAGIDQSRARTAIGSAEIAAELHNNMELARQLRLSGTPAFIVGDQVFSGAVGYERLKQAIAEAREARATSS